MGIIFAAALGGAFIMVPVGLILLLYAIFSSK